jgi:hypothetical protein
MAVQIGSCFNHPETMRPSVVLLSLAAPFVFASAATVPLVRLERSSCQAGQNAALGTLPPSSVPILNDGELALLSWFSFGTPGQANLMQLDTGSTLVWTANESVAVRYQHHGFKASASSTFTDERYQIELSYGSGSLYVAAGRDTFSWAPSASFSVSSAQSQFGVAVNGGGWVQNGWYQFDNDGIVGLSMPALCQWRDCSQLAWQQLFASAGLPPLFSFFSTATLNPINFATDPRLDFLGDDQRARLAQLHERECAPRVTVSHPDGADHRATLERQGSEQRGLHTFGAAERASSGVASSMTIGGFNTSHTAPGASLYTIPLMETGNGMYGYYWTQLFGVSSESPVAPVSTDDDGSPTGANGESWCTDSSDPYCQVLFDSGTSLLGLRTEVANNVISLINQASGNTCQTDSQSGAVMCDKASVQYALLPNITFTFQVGAVSSIPSAGISQPPTSATQGGYYQFLLAGVELLDCAHYGAQCRVLVFAIPQSAGSINFILGDTFFRSYVIVFDAAHHTVSLARSILGPEPIFQPGSLTVLEIALIIVGSLVGAAVLIFIGITVWKRCEDRRQEKARRTLDSMRGGLVTTSDYDSGHAVMFLDSQYVAVDQ